MSGAWGVRLVPPAQMRVGDAERESAVAALSEHYVAGRITKDELDERLDGAWGARTSGDLAPLFSDLPLLQRPAPRPRPSRPSRRPPGSWWLGVRLSWVFVWLLVLAVTSHVPWFAVAIFGGLWWSGAFRGMHRWSSSRQPR
jgi:DUF1707 SHOCT-like domain